MIFSTSYCPYCAQVKALFQDLNVPHTVWEVDQLAEGSQIRQFLADETGQTTVPNVFVGGKHVGGCDGALFHIYFVSDNKHFTLLIVLTWLSYACTMIFGGWCTDTMMLYQQGKLLEMVNAKS